MLILSGVQHERKESIEMLKLNIDRKPMNVNE